MGKNADKIIALEEKVSAHNYHPLPVVIHRAHGVWVEDVDGRKYLDMLSAYSALNQGHNHPRIIAAAKKQLDTLSLTSRAFHNNQMAPFLEKLTALTGYDKALLMNTGAEAVETAIKAARRWGYFSKGVQPNKAEIIVCDQNFHGRTTTIVGFSSDEGSKKGYGPFPQGFVSVPFSNLEALKTAINPNTVGFLIEPIQGEAGVQVPYGGFLKEAFELCRANRVLFMADEIQTGLGRTGKLFCHHYDGIKPDILILGKALGGGIYPVSTILADDTIMNVAFEPGSHGSTFGGNPLACAIASTALDVLLEEKLTENALEVGTYFRSALSNLQSPLIKEVRGRGLLIAIELTSDAGKARQYTQQLMELGVLAKETHQVIIRFAPPLIITKEKIDWAMERIARVFN